MIDKVDVTVTNKKGDTLLGAAVVGGNLAVVKKLLARGVTLSDRENPLFYMAHTPCPKESYDGAKLLLEKGLLDEKRIRAALDRARQEGDKKLAVFQLFDGVQCIAGGALRGAGDLKFAFAAGAFGYWIVGFPVALLFGFGLGWGAPGIWSGLTLGLVTVAVVLTVRFYRLSGKVLTRIA